VESKNPLQSDKVYTVSEVTRLIKQELESRFPEVWVLGEISGFTRAHSGHLYFTLKDEASQIAAVMWRTNAEKVPFELENGLEVVCKGRINVYEPRGQYQLQVEQVEPKGKGAFQLAFEQLKEKLHKEGLFDPEKKKKLPLLPKKVGVVTSSRGAAVVDIIRTLERRFARLHLLLYPVRVQGEGAAEEIVEGLETRLLKRVGEMILEGLGTSHPAVGADLIAQVQDPQIRSIISALTVEDRSWDRESCLKIVGQYQTYLRKRQERVLLKKIKEAEKADNQKLLHELLGEKQRRLRGRLNAI